MCVLSIELNAQNFKTEQKVITIVHQREIYLNGGARAAIGGKSRTSLKIDLPKNTTSWYYSFSTSPGESGTKNLNLAVQLSSLATGGITKAVLENIQVPSGSGAIDVYLLDRNNIELFENKVDNTGGTFYYKREGSAFNTKQGLISINEFNTGTYFLGLKNPSSLDGIDIFIEVVAITEELQQFTDEQNEAITFGDLGWKAFERGDYDKCLEYCNKAIGLDKSFGYIYFNMGLSYFMKGQSSDAIETYSKAISVTKKSSIPKETFKGAMDDLKKYLKQFPNQDDANDIYELLKQEYRNY